MPKIILGYGVGIFLPKKFHGSFEKWQHEMKIKYLLYFSDMHVVTSLLQGGISNWIKSADDHVAHGRLETHDIRYWCSVTSPTKSDCTQGFGLYIPLQKCSLRF